MTIPRSQKKAANAFSLVELLVVISIIGLLAGLSSVAIPKALEAGKKARAKGELMAIVSAMKAYRQEYGRWPVLLPDGIDTEDSEAAGTYSWFDADNSKTLMKILAASPKDSTGLNPKGIRFLEGPLEDGTFLDPWKTQYIVKLDTNESNSIEYWGEGNKPNISSTVIAISYGPDKQMGNPTSTSTSTFDDVFSWEDRPWKK